MPGMIYFVRLSLLLRLDTCSDCFWTFWQDAYSFSIFKSLMLSVFCAFFSFDFIKTPFCRPRASRRSPISWSVMVEQTMFDKCFPILSLLNPLSKLDVNACLEAIDNCVSGARTLFNNPRVSALLFFWSCSINLFCFSSILFLTSF